MKGIRTSAKSLGAMKVKRAVVFTLVSLAFVSPAFAVLRSPFPAKPAAPFDGELIITGDDLVPELQKRPLRRFTERRYRKRIIRWDSARRRVEVVCFVAAAAAVPPAALRLAMVKEPRLAHHPRVRRVLSARLDNPAAYRPRACLSFRNVPSRKVERKSLRRFPS